MQSDDITESQSYSAGLTRHGVWSSASTDIHINNKLKIKIKNEVEEIKAFGKKNNKRHKLVV